MTEKNKINAIPQNWEQNENTWVLDVTQEEVSPDAVVRNTSGDIESLLWNNYKAVQRLLYRKICLFIHESNFSFLQKYKDGVNLNKEKISEKFNKYYKIHENALVFALMEEYEKMNNPEKGEERNLIYNFISKYLYILFIFSEKIKISDLKRMIRLPVEVLGNMYNGTHKRIEALEEFGVKETEKLRELYGQDIESLQNSYTWKSGDKFIDEVFLSSMYRYLHKQVQKREKDDSPDIAIEISKWFEENYKTAFDKLYYIFATWAESGSQKTDEGLLNIEIVLRRLIDGMFFLKSQDIAFSDFPVHNMNQDIFLEKFSEKFIDEKYFETYGPVFEKVIKCTCTDNFQQKQVIRGEINEELQRIAREKSQSRMPIKTRKHDSINVWRVWFEQWTQVLDSQKYDYVFSKVIANNGKVHFANFLKLDNEKYFNVFFEYYVINQEVAESEREAYKKRLKNQLQVIRSFEGKSLQEFIESDVNNLNFVVLWWRFVLKVRQVGNEPNLKKILEIPDVPYGITERISEDLQDIIQEWRITFDPDGRIKNTSVKGTNTILMDLMKGLKKWFIDISKESIKLLDGQKKNLWQIRDFYLPPGIANEEVSPQEEVEMIERYINSGIDALFVLLQGKKVEDVGQGQYIQNLIDAKVLPIWELSQDDLERIQYLVEILKFTKNRIKHIQEMLDIADKDTEILKQNSVIKGILGNDEKSGFWPRKRFSRAFEKLMAEYGGNFNEIGDFTRLRVMVEDNPDDMVKQVTDFVRAAAGMEEVTHVTVVDKTGEPISMPMKASGYRDTKVLLKMQSGNTVEVQFQYRSMYHMKSDGMDLTSSESQRVFEKMKQEESLFETEEMQKFLEYCQKHHIQLPKKEILMKLMKEPQAQIEWEKYRDLLIKTKVSTDDTYHITRTLDKKDPVRVKFTRLERVLADVAQAKIVINYLKWKRVQL